MENQEWFERFKTRVRFDDSQHYPPSSGLNWRVNIVQSALLKMAVHMLPALERKIVQMVFFGECTEREAARRLKLSKSKIHRLKSKALKSLSRSNFIKLALLPRTWKRKIVNR